MTSDGEDPLADLERLSEDRPTYWQGRCRGGPLDGAGIDIEAVPFLEMRELRVTVAVGPTQALDWHAYVLDNEPPEVAVTTGRVTYFRYAGKTESAPPLPGSMEGE